MIEYKTWSTHNIRQERRDLSFEAENDEKAMERVLAWMARHEVYEAQLLAYDQEKPRTVRHEGLKRERPIKKLRVLVAGRGRIDLSILVSGEGQDTVVQSRALQAARQVAKDIRKALADVIKDGIDIDIDFDIEGCGPADEHYEEYERAHQIDIGKVS